MGHRTMLCLIEHLRLENDVSGNRRSRLAIDSALPVGLSFADLSNGLNLRHMLIGIESTHESLPM